MSKDMAKDLKKHNVASVSLRPGMVKTERFMSKRESLARNYKVDITRGGESAIYSGRAVAALAAGTLIMISPTDSPRAGSPW